MSSQTFSLQPFVHNAETQRLIIQGAIARTGHQLVLNYALTGHLDNILIPSPAATPSRQQNLWQATCFEFFLGIPGQSSYWEFNLSPAGHWNVYRFTDYRQGMTAEDAIASLPFQVTRQSQCLALTIPLDLQFCTLTDDSAVDIAVSTVIQFQSGAMSYWALLHAAEQPDFHQRQSFALRG